MGLLSALQATMSLPGIAGIVLTLGMAVDANVLIFERIKEELKDGQKKLDKNHNGKLDGQDFKMLRKEEAEGIDEVLDTPMKKLGYIAKNAYQVAASQCSSI